MAEDVSPKPPVEPTYLGDAVYARFDGFHVWIWTSDGIRNSPEIALEPSVLAALNDYAKRCGMPPR